MPEPSHVAEHFEDAEQQSRSATLGMWTFLATEILFFGALFVAYAVYRTRWPVAFQRGSEDLRLVLGGINTAVLLTSSLTVALAVRSAALGRNGLVIAFLIATIVLGLGFLGIKAGEYVIESHDRLVPSAHFSIIPPDEIGLPPQQQHPRPQQEKLFMMFYFIMTGIHAAHMIVGVGLFSVILAMTWRGHFSAEYHTPIEISGLYWHFVDIVWVFLYPMLYLLRHS